MYSVTVMVLTLSGEDPSAASCLEDDTVNEWPLDDDTIEGMTPRK